MDKKHNYKVGDKVYVHANTVWRGVHTVVAVYTDTLTVRHETRGNGGFYFDQIIPEEIYNSPLYQALKENK